jgi:hypothetical protein
MRKVLALWPTASQLARRRIWLFAVWLRCASAQGQWIQNLVTHAVLGAVLAEAVLDSHNPLAVTLVAKRSTKYDSLKTLPRKR